MKRFLVLAMLLWPTYAQADFAIKPAQDVKVDDNGAVLWKPGRNLRLKVEDAGAIVRWDAGGSDVDLIPYQEPNDPTIRALFLSPRDGTYRVIAWTAKDGVPSEPAVLFVVVGKPAPVPPGPGPGPTDPLAQALKAAYDLETSSHKAAQKATLAGVYREVATVDVPAASSLPELVKLIQARHDSLMPQAALSKVRRAIAEQLTKRLPTQPNASLDKALCIQVFTEVANALDSL